MQTPGNHWLFGAFHWLCVCQALNCFSTTTPWVIETPSSLLRAGQNLNTNWHLGRCIMIDTAHKQRWYMQKTSKNCIDTVKSLQQLADIDPTCLHEMFPGSPLNGSFHHLPSYYPSDLVKYPPFVDGLYPEIWESSWIGPMLAPLITLSCQKSNIIHSCRWNSMFH